MPYMTVCTITKTKVVCPACIPGILQLFDKCLWCGGSKRLPIKDALRYADVVYMCAGGGYITGDYNYTEMRQQEAYARKIAFYCDDPKRFDN